MMNTRIREFREKLITLAIDDFQDIPLEAKYMALQLVINKTIESANIAVMEEMKEEENAESLCQNKLGE